MMHIRYYRSVRLSADTNGHMVLWVEMEPGSINEKRFQIRLPAGGRLTFERRIVESLNQGGVYMATTSLLGNDAGLPIISLVPRGPDDVAIRAFERYTAGAEKTKRRMWQFEEISRAVGGRTGKDTARAGLRVSGEDFAAAFDENIFRQPGLYGRVCAGSVSETVRDLMDRVVRGAINDRCGVAAFRRRVGLLIDRHLKSRLRRAS
ncbi:hypothetical protein [Brytella acorum]|uniref:Uncharacterized protein n=1 Tax=Brytella acorum TaxID=2959299 RepID=A0AA35Y3S2_9PROT|nr:hypothetical protein [Brytella acorum]CAI9120467.1 hypothetical protein LMG32879_001300 [Brytella acorum]